MKIPIYKKLLVAGKLLALAMLLLSPGKVLAQNWQLVWADEFNGSIGPDWSFETGGGGWGNNELEYYQSSNATIANVSGLSALAITARNQSVGGMNYTSARMNTGAHQAWRYGKIVASINLPAFQGSWPAFWMLGSNIGSVGWPTCGEIDIMEQINTANTVNGSTHWYSGGQADWTSSAGTNVTGWHEYSITWDSNYIRWYIDNNQYSQFFIGGNAGGTNAFNQNSFFIILNLAVGGNWPGFSVNNGALPASMFVDWVRVYQDAPPPAIGVYQLGSYGNPGQCLQGTGDPYLNANGGYVSGCNEVAATPSSWNIPQQQWSVLPLGNGQYHIMSTSSGQFLQATGDPYHAHGGGNVAGCNKVALTPNTWNVSQQVWQISNAGTGYAVGNPANGQYLQATGNSYWSNSAQNYVAGCNQMAATPQSWGVSSQDQWNFVWIRH